MPKIQPLIYADDSGDPGFNFAHGSSRFFVIALVLFENDADAEEVQMLIEKYRQDLGWSPNKEFKFYKSRSMVRTGFFRIVRRGNFSIRAVLVDKAKLTEDFSSRNKMGFYHFIVKELMAHYDDLFEVRLRMDGKAENEYKRAVATYLRKNLNTANRVIANFSYVNSVNDSLIQLADMTAGAIRRTAETDKTDHLLYYNIIKEKIFDLWYYGQ